MKLEFSPQVFEKYSMSNFIKIRLVGTELLQTDMNLFAVLRKAVKNSFLPHSLEFNAQSLNAEYGYNHRFTSGSHRTHKDTVWAERRILMSKLLVCLSSDQSTLD